MKCLLVGEEAKIEIDLIHRSYPTSMDYWDGNWVDSRIKVEIPGYVAHFDSYLRTDELQDFFSQLKKMNDTLTGKAALHNLDNYIQIEGEMTKTGMIHWTAETCYPAGYGAVLTFEFASDQSYLNELIEQLDELLLAYPVVGTPE
ncbi:hypothetical protein [Bacillus sp. CGMCC 1.16541]|uniref:WapI family immunity protein n=1 Tax=Bacillus sp. CGMCC 1.16541 TaxID=2185143 RepID=UPI000D7331B9|nr:hypothetical protein [Bacillus sp. CGMCC 1.16541]